MDLKFYAEPSGMMKLRLSANSPHATRFSWNIVIQIPKPIAQANAPIADRITSAKKYQTISWMIEKKVENHQNIFHIKPNRWYVYKFTFSSIIGALFWKVKAHMKMNELLWSINKVWCWKGAYIFLSFFVHRMQAFGMLLQKTKHCLSPKQMVITRIPLKTKRETIDLI